MSYATAFNALMVAAVFLLCLVTTAVLAWQHYKETSGAKK